MARVNRVQDIVFEILQDYPETRGDDFLLVLEVYKRFAPVGESFESILRRHIEIGLPSFASIVRARRKLQVMHPELIDIEAADVREIEEEFYREYARC